MSQGKWLFWLWTGLILLVVLPWAGFQSHAHWQRVAWIPFVSPPVKVRDILVNVALYAPWGYLYVRQMPEHRKRLWMAIVFAAILSVGSEASQLYSHGRFPSATDTMCNVLGAFAGVQYARRRNHSMNERSSMNDEL